MCINGNKIHIIRKEGRKEGREEGREDLLLEGKVRVGFEEEEKRKSESVR